MADENAFIDLTGSCHCGRVRLALQWPQSAAGEVGQRACQCRYCQSSGGVWSSHPDARLQLSPGDALTAYRFATETADFLFCRHCGTGLAAVSRIEGQDVAVVRSAAIDWPADWQRVSENMDFSAEDRTSRLARRRQRWIGQVQIN